MNQNKNSDPNETKCFKNIYPPPPQKKIEITNQLDAG